MFRSFFKSIGFLAKNLVVTYNWLHPELALGGCVMKYARAQYPELLQSTITYDNITKFVRSVYGMMYGYVREYIDENQQDIAIERERIGAKVAQITDYDTHAFVPSTSNYNSDYINNYVQDYGTFQYNQQNVRRQSRENEDNILSVSAKSFNELESRRQMASFKFNENNFFTNSINKENATIPKKNNRIISDLKLRNENVMPLENVTFRSNILYETRLTTLNSTSIPRTNSNIITKNVENKFLKMKLKDDLNVAQNNNKKEMKWNSIMYVGPRQFSTNFIPNSSKDGISTVVAGNENVTNNELLTTIDSSDVYYGKDDEKGDNLFDFENAILESFGFKTKGKSITLTTCTQKYVINILWRMLEDYFTG